jgi:hypothetical protein
MNTKSLDNLDPKAIALGNGKSLASIQGVIEEKTKGNNSKRAFNLSKIESRKTIQVGNAGLGTKIKENLEGS